MRCQKHSNRRVDQSHSKRTFKVRGTSALPLDLPPPPAAWQVPYRRLAGNSGLAAELEAGHAAAAKFVDPILRGQVTAGSWDPAAGASR